MWMVVALLGFLGLLGFLTKEKRYKWFYILYKTLPRDLRATIRFVKLNIYLSRWEKGNMTVAKIFTRISEQQPHKVAYYFEEDIWTFHKVEEYTNRIANYFKAEGYCKGDRVALLLESRPEYVCLWLGLSKIGVVTALINTNLTNDPLLHSISIANSKAIIFGSDFSRAITDILPKITSLKLYQFHERQDPKAETLERAENLRLGIDGASVDSPTQRIEEGKIRDQLIYIYTSGTTGLPKAAVISNLRYIFMTTGIYMMGALRPADCVYDSLPLYHSAGGICGAGQALIHGLTVALRKKFSASNFWKDCVKYECTVAQYIGEICRYLLAVHGDNRPPSPPKHRVRAMIGNGLKPQIWRKLVRTFDVDEICEFYGATEGNSNLINIDSTPGAVGFVPRYAKALYPVALIKWNEKSNEPVRTGEGLCVRCGVNEPGIFVGKIGQKRALSQFTGYADRSATEEKILRDVFRKGDMYFNSGDLLVYDELGYYYFKDRTGDTFRWKGENVSTSEVEAVISNVVGLNDAIVYGVEVAGTEGRVGMAAVVDLNESLDLDRLCQGLRANLPPYALPLFLRVIETVPLTGTYKLIKRDIQREGYDVNLIRDSLYFYEGKLGKYVDLSRELYDRITRGDLRV